MKTKLEAVNDILQSNQEMGVDSLDPENDEAVYNAIIKLKQATKYYLSKNLVINTDIDYKLYPNSEGYIEIPNFLKVNFYNHDYKVARQRDDGKFYVYNYKENTYYFSEGSVVECDLIRDMDFEDIPDYELQEMITLKASIEYYKIENTYDNTVQAMSQDLSMREYELMIDISYNMNGNIFNGEDFKGKWGYR